MKKAKALFAIGIIVIVSGASVALWQLNDNGLIENETTTVYSEETKTTEKAQETENKNQEEENKTENKTEENESATEKKLEFSETEINDFLTTFSKVYFAEKGKAFNINKYNTYDMILFAFSHIRCTYPSQITLEQRDDSIKYYNGVSAEKVNEVLDRYFGITVSEESVYTENSYAFFSYSDGYFYTPATDGLAYINNTVVRSAEQDGNYIIAQFDIYSDGEYYAEGEAKIRQDKDGMKLVFYSVNK